MAKVKTARIERLNRCLRDQFGFPYKVSHDIAAYLLGKTGQKDFRRVQSRQAMALTLKHILTADLPVVNGTLVWHKPSGQ